MSSRSSRTVYVGNLPGDIREREVEDLFSKYGPVVQIDLKVPPRPPGYAFVEFDDARDAEDAIHGRDGYDFDGHRLRVELAHGGRRSTDDARGSYNGGGRGGAGGGRDGGSRGRGPSRRSEFRVLVTGLPSSASWQDLKDHMRKGGDVCFSQVYRDGRGTTGVVDYTCYEDMKYAVKKLDDTEFRNAFSHGYVRVREHDSRKDSRSPSRGRSYSRSRSRSRGRSLSRSRSRSRSPKAKSSGRSPAKPPGSRSKSRSQSPRRSLSRSRSPLPSLQKEASKSPSKPSSAKSPIRSRSRSPIPYSEESRAMKKLLKNSFIMLFLLLFLAFTAVSSLEAYSRNDFPPGFVFGSGTSAYQVEGAANEDGRTPSIWDVFAHAGLSGGDTGDVACDQYHKYKAPFSHLSIIFTSAEISCDRWTLTFASCLQEDVKLMVEIGLEAYRFSISWSRLLPSGRGAVNPKGLQYYNNLIDELITHGIQPHVTLHHFDLPQVLEDEYGGWLSRESVRDFTAYADTCFKEFGDRVSHWTTINEINVFALGGYDAGSTPPGRCSPPFGLHCSKGNSSTEPYIAVHNMLLAHASAVNLYKQQYKSKQHGSVGISVYTYGTVPLTNSAEDKQAADRMNDFYIGWILHPLVYGDYPERMKTMVGSRLPDFTEDESDQVKGAMDFVGVINYMAFYVKDSSSSLKQTLVHDFNTDMAVELTFVGDTSFKSKYANTPWSLQQILLYIKENYGNPPIYIAENGQMTPQQSSLEDITRTKYLSPHIEAVLHSLRKGSNVKGYFQWSLMDLFELLGGYNMSYGLYYVEFKDPDLKRYPKLSAHWYSSFLGGTLHHRSHPSSSAL
ncbi:unnamed protein product [Thlaspi arvense]|uniref:beta-glucosidase n=1 Tax=Thlaspi arvense TaxID=13288 RepID=A0AAU9RFG6_THLAR|nr:unnamed protein product [Thlaspi arvense]